MISYRAYIDESGDPNFNEGASESYFLCATLVPDEVVASVVTELKSIQKRHDLHEFKSSKVSSDVRRLEILAEFSALPISALTLFVKKRDLNGNWFRYQGSFYKYIQRRLISEVFRVFGNANVTFDSYGREKFQQSFKDYIEKRLQFELFTPAVSIESAKDNVLLQLSDFLAGSIRKEYEGSIEGVSSILNTIWKGKSVLPDRRPPLPDQPGGSQPEDEIIAKIALESVERYIHTNTKTDEKATHMQVLDYLQQMAFEEPERFCFRGEIIAWLSFMGIEMSEEDLSRTIISDLRDDGVLLASSQEGIKLPTTYRDILSYYQFCFNQSLPTLRRLKKADQLIEVHLREKHQSLIASFGADAKKVLEQLHT
jgi:Protein of unknown function (DUF3800)